MGQVIINVPDALEPRLRDALVAKYAPNGETPPVPVNQLAKWVCVEKLKEILREFEIEQAKRTAGEQKSVDIQADLNGIS